MHSTLVIIHSLLRWVILALILFKLYQAYSGWFGKKEWTPLDKKVSIFSIFPIDHSTTRIFPTKADGITGILSARANIC